MTQQNLRQFVETTGAQHSFYLHIEHMRQMLSFGLPHAVSSIGDKHHRHFVLPIVVHQVPKALLCSRDRGSAPYQHSIDVKQEPKGVGALRRDLDQKA